MILADRFAFFNWYNHRKKPSSLTDRWSGHPASDLLPTNLDQMKYSGLILWLGNQASSTRTKVGYLPSELIYLHGY